MNDEHRSYKCVECGHLCKTQHGLKTYMGMKHKNNSRKTKNRKKQLLKATRKYNKSAKGKLRSQKYGKSAKGKLKHQRYEKSIKGKLRKNNYKTSVRGRKTRQRNAKRKQEIKKAKKKKENELPRLLHRKKMETKKKKNVENGMNISWKNVMVLMPIGSNNKNKNGKMSLAQMIITIKRMNA